MLIPTKVFELKFRSFLELPWSKPKQLGGLPGEEHWYPVLMPNLMETNLEIGRKKLMMRTHT
eukprot:1120540-Rhodomonas_salina.1